MIVGYLGSDCDSEEIERQTRAVVEEDVVPRVAWSLGLGGFVM